MYESQLGQLKNFYDSSKSQLSDQKYKITINKDLIEVNDKTVDLSQLEDGNGSEDFDISDDEVGLK